MTVGVSNHGGFFFFGKEKLEYKKYPFRSMKYLKNMLYILLTPYIGPVECKYDLPLTSI